jgi:thiol-disulfide isomerase/thioredoxin
VIIEHRWLVPVIAGLLVCTPAAAAAPPIPGEQLAAIRLPAPETADAMAYLGVARENAFDPLNVAGSLLVIEIFSMYCPHCQREAPKVNRLYQAIASSPQLAGRVKLIGIGVGNSPYEVNHFRKHYTIPFPLFADEAFIVHQALGEVRTPFFIIVSTDSADRGIVLGTVAGSFGTVESFIQRLNGFMEQR